MREGIVRQRDIAFGEYAKFCFCFSKMQPYPKHSLFCVRISKVKKKKNDAKGTVGVSNKRTCCAMTGPNFVSDTRGNYMRPGIY